jgi:8-oxo-dGTP pyrophosphatase MutT (NUDIX family)
MFTPRILRKGPFGLDDIGIEIADEAWRAPPHYDERVADAWRALVRAADAEGHRLWDGIHYRVANLEALGSGQGAPALRLGSVSFRYIATYRALHEAHLAAGLAPTHHLSIAALIRTRDGHYLFGKRKRNGTIDFIGGGVQPSELAVSRGADLERTLFKEMEEEVGLHGGDFDGTTGLGIVMSGTSNVLIIAHAPARLAKDEVEAAFARREEDEMAEPVFVPEPDLPRYLRAMTDYRVLVADLL